MPLIQQNWIYVQQIEFNVFLKISFQYWEVFKTVDDFIVI